MSISTIEFETAYRTLKRPLEGYIRAFSPSLPVDDLVAESFMAIWENREKYLPERGTLKGFLWSHAKTVVYKHWRTTTKQYKLTKTPEPLNTTVQPPASIMEDINHAVERLPVELREVLKAYAYDNLTHSEIAVKLGITEELSRKRLERARARLRN